MFYLISDGRCRLYRFPPTRGAAFCIGFDALGAFGALAAGLAAAGAFLAVVAFWVFLTSLAALKSEKNKNNWKMLVGAEYNCNKCQRNYYL